MKEPTALYDWLANREFQLASECTAKNFSVKAYCGPKFEQLLVTRSLDPQNFVAWVRVTDTDSLEVMLEALQQRFWPSTEPDLISQAVKFIEDMAPPPLERLRQQALGALNQFRREQTEGILEEARGGGEEEEADE